MSFTWIDPADFTPGETITGKEGHTATVTHLQQGAHGKTIVTFTVTTATGRPLGTHTARIKETILDLVENPR